jgi:hypothetical protein
VSSAVVEVLELVIFGYKDYMNPIQKKIVPEFTCCCVNAAGRPTTKTPYCYAECQEEWSACLTKMFFSVFVTEKSYYIFVCLLIILKIRTSTVYLVLDFHSYTNKKLKFFR